MIRRCRGRMSSRKSRGRWWRGECEVLLASVASQLRKACLDLKNFEPIRNRIALVRHTLFDFSVFQPDYAEMCVVSPAKQRCGKGNSCDRIMPNDDALHLKLRVEARNPAANIWPIAF